MEILVSIIGTDFNNFFILDQYIGNMVKANVIFGMQDYLGVSLTKCNVSTKVGATPIKVGVLKYVYFKIRIIIHNSTYYVIIV